MKKKLLSLALALALSLGLAVPAMAYDIQSGNTVWTASNAPTGTETVKIAQLEFVSPPVENIGSKGNLGNH